MHGFICCTQVTTTGFQESCTDPHWQYSWRVTAGGFGNLFKDSVAWCNYYSSNNFKAWWCKYLPGNITFAKIRRKKLQKWRSVSFLTGYISKDTGFAKTVPLWKKNPQDFFYLQRLNFADAKFAEKIILLGTFITIYKNSSETLFDVHM